MHIRPANPGEGPVCDALLTRLIQTERQWEPNLDETFTVCDNYEHRMAEEGTLLLVAEENDESVAACCLDVGYGGEHIFFVFNGYGAFVKLACVGFDNCLAAAD